MISIEKQKKISIKMWQYVKAQIMQHAPIYSITYIKKNWLRNNYPDIQWKNACLFCDIYLHPRIIDGCFKGYTCSDCPLTRKYKGRASYGCAIEQGAVTPWTKVTNYYRDEKAAIEACDEIIEAIKSV